MKFNRAAIEDKVVRLARWLDLRTPTFDGFMQWTLDLRREIGIPHTLAELGVKVEHLDKFAEMAAVDPTAGGNPVKAGVPEMRKMYEAAREREAVMMSQLVLPDANARRCQRLALTERSEASHWSS